ncbi:dihydrofolate reductase family protein [Isoptericola sp. NPDC019571]|uniref:dihydrofolate reductase family protein n=1 Tax=Isoptericola sp. NPDC019571 TaxID=3364008 RepID=UPI0037913A30
MTQQTRRTVAANLSLSLDGRYHGPGGPADFGAFLPYVATDTARDHLVRLCAGATTAVLGRGNAEGFLGYWSPVAGDEAADPRDRAYARWLVDTPKVVLSRTLGTAPWPRARVVDAPAADVVRGLRDAGQGDVLVNSSPSVIKPVLAADLIDRLYLLIAPVIVGGGERLFDDGLPGTTWTLSSQVVGAQGEVAAVYDRVR